MKNVQKNIVLAYILTFCKNSWFWLGIWVFYYLQFTNYAGIGIIETVLIVTMTLTEIPTGAVADLFGKRKTLFLSFLLQAVGALWMALTPNFSGLALSVFIMGVGGTLYSGTLEALVYDTLKQNKLESTYDRTISIISSIQLIAPAVCGVIGGFLYALSPSLPFFANAFFYFLGIVTTLFLVEPLIDTEKFSWTNYVNQTKQGIKQLTKTISIRNQTILLLSIGLIGVILDEMLYSFLGVEFGLKAESIGIVWAVIFLISAIAVQTTPFIRQSLGDKKAVILTGGVISITLIVSPILGLMFGVVSILLSSAFLAILTNLTSIIINKNTESKYRATTLSTFNMIKNIPYVLSAYFIGSLSDTISAKNSAMVLGLILIFFLLIQMIKVKPNKQLVN
jgi:MFS family permease